MDAVYENLGVRICVTEMTRDRQHVIESLSPTLGESKSCEIESWSYSAVEQLWRTGRDLPTLWGGVASGHARDPQTSLQSAGRAIWRLSLSIYKQSFG